MSVIELGAIGEFLGAIAVVATLVYLTTQIRQSTRSMASQAHAQVAAEMQQNLRAMSQDDALAIAFMKATRGEDLEPLEGTKLTFWFFAFGRGWESHILQSKLGALEEVEAPAAQILRFFATMPFFRNLLENYIGTESFKRWLGKNVLGGARK